MRKIVIQSVKNGKTLEETFEEVNDEFGMLFDKYEVEEEYKKQEGENAKMAF
jgi:hypothetical protein